MLYLPSASCNCQSATLLMALRMSRRFKRGERSVASGPGSSGWLPAAARSSEDCAAGAEGFWHEAKGDRARIMEAASTGKLLIGPSRPVRFIKGRASIAPQWLSLGPHPRGEAAEAAGALDLQRSQGRSSSPS